MYQNVLVATDGSPIATMAADQAIAIAAQLEATVHVVSVAEGERGSEDASEDARRRCQTIVDDVEADATARGISVVSTVRTGNPSQELLEYVDEHDIDLCVLGTHGRTGIRRWIMGSVATAVVRDAQCPVLTVNPSVNTPVREFDDVLIATDARPGVDAAVDQSIDFAAAFESTLHSLYVVNDTHSRMDVVLDAFEELGEQSTTKIDTRATERGLQTERAIERGEPHDVIVSYADDHDVDLIVVGTESRSGIERLVVGSVSQRVVAAASAPVLSVRTLER